MCHLHELSLKLWIRFVLFKFWALMCIELWRFGYRRNYWHSSVVKIYFNKMMSWWFICSFQWFCLGRIWVDRSSNVWEKFWIICSSCCSKLLLGCLEIMSCFLLAFDRDHWIFLVSWLFVLPAMKLDRISLSLRMFICCDGFSIREFCFASLNLWFLRFLYI